MSGPEGFGGVSKKASAADDVTSKDIRTTPDQSLCLCTKREKKHQNSYIVPLRPVPARRSKVGPGVYEESDVSDGALRRVSERPIFGPGRNGAHLSVDRCSSSLMDRFSRRPSLYQVWSMVLGFIGLGSPRTARGVAFVWGKRAGGLRGPSGVSFTSTSCSHDVAGDTNMGNRATGALSL